MSTTVYESSFDFTKTIKVKITSSDSEMTQSITRTPQYLLNNDNNGSFDGNKRWAAYGNKHYLEFEFDQILTIHGLNIAWYQGNEFRYMFKITSNSVDHVLFNGVSDGTSNYQTYEFDRPVNTRNIRILCNGNTVDDWNRISAIKFRLEPIPTTEQTVDPYPTCPEGQRWHEILGKCVPNEITEPPIIKIQPTTQIIKQGDNVFIDGSQTTDPVGSTLYYEWIQIAGDLVNTGNKLQPTLTFRAPTIDTELKFRLLVTNSGDLKSYGDATVIVRADKPIVNISEVKQILDQRLPAVSEIHTPKAKKRSRKQ